VSGTADAARWRQEIRDYWSGRAEFFGNAPAAAHGGRRTLGMHPVWLGAIDMLITRSAPPRPVSTVADMGSGTGEVAELLAKLGYRVIAVEFAPGMVAGARQRFAGSDTVEVREGDAVDPPLATGEVDAIVSRNLIWLLPDPEEAVRRWASLVGAGGRIAAIDGTWRTAQERFVPLRRFARGLVPGRAGDAQPRNPVNAARRTPLAAIPTPDPALEVWRRAGLVNVQTLDLGWVDAVEQLAWSTRQRVLNRTRRFAVIGDVPTHHGV
jgi:SAM-dependent methyltransferase